MLASSVGQALTKHIHELLDLMFHFGLSASLNKTLIDLGKFIPQLLPTIQERLLNLLSVTLSGENFRIPGAPVGSFIEEFNGNTSWREGTVSHDTAIMTASHDPATIELALEILGSFDFKGKFLLLVLSQSLTSDSRLFTI